MVQTPRQGPRRPGRPRKEQPAPVQWSPVTERLCERALELAAEHKAKPPGSELSPGARSILLQLRAAIRAKKPCRFTGVGQLEEKFRLSQGYISRMAQEQSHSGRLLSGLRAGRPADWWEDKDGWYKKMAAALKKGRGQRRGTSAWFLSKELGKSEDWCRRHRKRFFIPAVEEKIADPSIPAFKAPVWHFKDNAPPHVAKLTTEFLSEYAEDETIVPHPIPQAPRCPESNVLDMSVFNWLQQCVDSAEVVTREEIKAETLRAWNDMPESVILNSFNHLEPVHKTIVELQGGNRTNQ